MFRAEASSNLPSPRWTPPATAPLLPLGGLHSEVIAGSDPAPMVR